MRTCLTITLLLWASLASQAQAAGLIPGQATSAAASICSGQACQRSAWAAADQTPAFLPDYPHLAGPALEQAPSLPSQWQALPVSQPRRPSQPRAP